MQTRSTPQPPPTAPVDLVGHVGPLYQAGYGPALHAVIPPGAQLVPRSTIVAAQIGKIPGRWSPAGWHGYAWTKESTDRSQLERDLERGSSLGMRTCDTPFLDVDVMDPGIAQAIEQAIVQALGQSPKRIGRAPKFAMPFRLGGSHLSKMIIHLRRGGEQLTDKVELLGDGNQVVIAGTHPGTREPYSWSLNGGPAGGLEVLAGIPHHELPEISAARIIDVLLPVLEQQLAPLGVSASLQGSGTTRAETPPDQGSLRAPSVAAVRELVAQLANESDQPEYVRVGRMIRGACGEDSLAEGLETYHEWASRHPEGPDGKTTPEATWETLRPPHYIGWQELLTYAQKQGINTGPLVFDADPEAVPPVESAQALAAHIADFNARYALIRKMANTILHTPAHGEAEFLPIDHWRTLTTKDQIAVGGRQTPISKLWIAHPARREFRKITMDPTQPAYSATRVPGDVPDFNLWPGLALRPSAEGSADLFLDHLRHVVCQDNDASYEWVLMWFAALVQHPERLTGTALVLRGEQGSGKSIVGEVMGKILGEALYGAVSKPDELTGRFNSHHQGKLLLQVEEGFFAGDKSAIGALKHMITSATVRIERKFMDAFDVPNYMRLLITSNEGWVIPAGLGERRFMVLDVSNDRADDWDYFARLRAQMFEAGGAAQLLHVLLNTSIDWRTLSRPISTQALRDQQIASLDAEGQWLLDLLDEGQLPGDANGEGLADRDALYRLYQQFLRDHHAGRRTSRESLGRLLREQLLVTTARPRGEGGSRRRVYLFPPLLECRARFGSRLAAPPEWEGSETWLRDETVLAAAL